MSRFAGKRGKKLPGAEFTWDDDPGGEPDTAPTPLFPKYKVPRAEKLTPLEQKQVDYYRSLREKIHDGPYYTVLGNAASFGKRNANPREQFDPFQGMPTYGEKFQKKTRTLPKLSGRPYVVNLFPKDLWATLDPKFVGLNRTQGGGLVARKGQKRGFEDDDEDQEVEEASKRRNVGEEGGDEEDEDEGDPLADEDEQDEEEIVDDDFSEDEEDMGGDYNAEQYFDGGDDDGDGYDGGGGDDNDVY